MYCNTKFREELKQNCHQNIVLVARYHTWLYIDIQGQPMVVPEWALDISSEEFLRGHGLILRSSSGLSAVPALQKKAFDDFIFLFAFSPL